MRALPWLLLLACGTAGARELPPQFGRYLPLYPGLYLDGGYGEDDHDRVYRQNGDEADTATPHYGETRFPERYGIAALTWHFPLFESYDIPYLSSRTHFARATLRYVDVSTEGAYATFASDASDDAETNADGLANSGSGAGDTTLEFGTFLYGSQDWRTRARTPLAALLLLGANLPTGVYEHEAPANAGTNHFAFHAKLALHWQPWRGGFVDAGLAGRWHSLNYEPQFDGLAPTRQGAERLIDASVAQRLLDGLYLTLFATDREGDPNEYRDVQFAPNAPVAAPDTLLISNRTFPTPGSYRDGGTALRTWGAALQYFVTQRWLAALHYTAPLSGKSGEFDLAFTDRQCLIGGGPNSLTCTESAGETVTVDGLGPARSFASESLMLTFTYNFGQGDAFACRGCE